METFGKDWRLAVRMLAKKPGFTVVAVVTLALGIAVNSTVFSMVSAFMIRRPPVHDPDRVMAISSINPNPVFQPDVFPVSAPNYLAWRGENHVFSELAAEDQFRMVSLAAKSESSVSGKTGQASGPADQPEAIQAAAVSPNYFSVMGAAPQLGRAFADGEDVAGRDRVVVLGHDVWQRKFGSDASLVGRSVKLNREDYTVIGVMPEDFRLLGITSKLWIPLVFSAADRADAARGNHYLHLYARLKPGISAEQARVEMMALGQRMQQEFPDTEKGWGVAVRTLHDYLVADFAIGNALAILMITVAFVLMIACANVAGLLLARAAGRRRELAIRISLGASRGRIMLQLLAEGLVIAALGGATGLLLSYWGIRLLRAGMDFNEAVAAVKMGLDWNVALFTAFVSGVSAILCAIVPALNASKTDVNSGLKEESRGASSGRSQTRLRSVMVTAEIALALFLLVGSGLLMRAMYEIHHQNLGFQTDRLLTAGVMLDAARYKDGTQQTAFVREVLAHLREIPGAQVVAAASDLPATGARRVGFRIQGEAREPTSATNSRNAMDIVVTPEYFSAAGISVMRGRTFTEMDSATSPRVAVVNQQFVQVHLKGREPLGQPIELELGAGSRSALIVGVVSNIRAYSEGARIEPQVFEAFLQRPIASLALMVRTTADPSASATALRNAVAQVDGELPLDRLMSMEAVVESQRSGNPLFQRILGTFAALALILASIGIYGLIAYSVGQRTHEIGIRMAVGAGSSDVLRMVLWQGVKITMIGAVVGVVLALPLPSVFGAMLYDIQIHEPGLYVVVPAALAAVTMLATYIPARRATRVDPMRALRQE
jgi:putative ABC transport system permease protein